MVLQKMLNHPASFTRSVKENARNSCTDGALRGKNLESIIIIYPAFTGFPVARSCFFIFLDRKTCRIKAIVSRGKFLACDMLHQTCLCLLSKPGPARRVPIEQGRLFYNRNMTDRERAQSVPPGTDMAVPLFFRVFGRGRLFPTATRLFGAGCFQRMNKCAGAEKISAAARERQPPN